MRVAVIAAEMEGRSTGVGRYLEGLLSGLARWDHGAEWHLFFQGSPSPLLPEDGGAIRTHFSHHRGSRVLWEQLSVAKALRAVEPDLVFGPAYTLPFGLRTPSVVTIHDLSFELLPAEFGPRERWRRRLAARRAARVADRVLTDTSFIASLVRTRYGLSERRVSVVPLGVDLERFSPESAAGDRGILDGLGVRPPYVLLLGTVLERRMPRVVLEAFAEVARDRPQLELVVAGANRMRRPGLLSRWIGELGLADRVRQLGWVDEAALAPLYRAAELGFAVSRHEGFGLPPLELLACGTPVVISGGLALDDAWPDYPYRVQELDTGHVVEATRELLDDPEGASRAIAKAAKVLDDLSWERSSRLLVAELERVVAS